MESREKKGKGTPIALLPLFVFLLLYLGVGTYLSMKGVENAFYQLPAPIAASIGIIAAFIISKGSIDERVKKFVKGAGDENVIMMCLIYLLAGAFALITKNMGGVNSTVNLGLTFVPSWFLLPGIFIISSFMSLAIGTSMGTLGALLPIGVGLANKTPISTPLILGTMIGGAMFGDNLSIISDTTIAATKTQGVSMKDKFRTNSYIAIPAALITIIILYFLGTTGTLTGSYPFNIVEVIPYIVVLITAILGVNVFIVLFIGIILSGTIGIFQGDLTPLTLAQTSYEGFTSMTKVFYLSILAGGLASMIREEGGLKYIINLITNKVKGTKGAEIGIGALVSATDICTANNTVSIIITGPLAKDIAKKNNVDPKRSASILDIFSAAWQGILPYGAQVLLAGSIAGISPIKIIPHVYYVYILLAAAILAIHYNYPKQTKQTKTKKQK